MDGQRGRAGLLARGSRAVEARRRLEEEAPDPPTWEMSLQEQLASETRFFGVLRGKQTTEPQVVANVPVTR